MQKETTYEVYRLTNSVNNKIYVGATTDGAGARWNRHVQKANAGSDYPFHQAIREFGKDSFRLDVLEMCDTFEKMNEREAHWIAILSATNPEIGYNKKIGGGIHLHDEEAKRKIGDIHRGKIAENRKPILQYDKNGVLIREFTSLSEAVLETGIAKTSIHRVLRKEATRFSKKNPYVWLWKENDTEVLLKINPKDYYKDLDFEVTPSETFKEKRAKFCNTNGDFGMSASPVEQYDLNGRLLGKFRSLSEATKITGISQATIRKYINDENYINTVAENRRKYIWKKGDPNDPDMKISKEEVLTKASKTNADVILLIDVNGEIVEEVVGITNLAKRWKADSRTIKRNILHNIPMHGYYLEYKTEQSNIE